MTDPYDERREMKRLKEYIDRRGYVADAEYGIPTRCPCGGGIVPEIAAEEAHENLPGKRYFTCKVYKDDGLHFRQPWVCGVEEEFQKVTRENENLKEELWKLTMRMAELERKLQGKDKDM